VFSARIKSDNNQIFSVNADGSNLVQLTHSAGFNNSPVWSPDGSEIVFSSTRFGNWDICIMDADGGNIKQVTKKDAGIKCSMDFHPIWSPDGQWIAFQSDRDTKKYKYGRKYRIGSKDRFFVDVYQLYIADREGHYLQPITSDPFRNDWKPSWSPDGKKIIFHSFNVIRLSSEIDQAQNRLEVINLDEKSRKVVAEDESNSGFGGFSQPIWSPVGNQIAFTSTSIKNNEVTSDLCTMDVYGEEFGPIKNLSVSGTNPCWSSDGKYLVFDSIFYKKDRWSIYIMNNDGTEVTPLTDIPYSCREPNWI